MRTFLNVNGDTIVAMLVAKPTGEIDRDVYNGTKTMPADDIDAESVDLENQKEMFARADRAD